MFEPAQGANVRYAEPRMSRWLPRDRGMATYLVGSLLAVASSTLPAVDWQVDTVTDTVDAVPGDGVCRDAAKHQCSLRAALIEANALPGTDRILLPAGIFQFTRPGLDDDASASGDLDIHEGVDIVGAGSALSIIDGMALDRMVEIHADDSGSVRIEGLTLRNGRDDRPLAAAESRGIGLEVHAGVQLFLFDVVIRDQHSRSLGSVLGIRNHGCIIGKALRVLDNRDPASPDGIAPTNRVGGIHTSGQFSCFDIEDFEFSGNDGRVTGALLVTDGGTVSLHRGLIAGNRSPQVSAVNLVGATTALLENVTLSENRGDTAALLSSAATWVPVQLIHCTVTRNIGLTGEPLFGGVAIAEGTAGATKIALTNTILAGNGPGRLGDDCNAVASELGGNIIGNRRCQLVNARADDQVGVDPGLGPLVHLGGFARAHTIGAAATDHAADAGCSREDQLQILRPIDGDGDGSKRCDIGAIEMPAKPRALQ